MKNITAAQWDAIAWAQGNFGVPDSVIAKIVNCPAGSVRAARSKCGWEIRDLTKAHSGMTGWRSGEGRSKAWATRRANAEEQFPLLSESDDSNLNEDADDADPALTLERLTAALARELNTAADGIPDAAALKRVEALVTAAKTFEKLMSIKPKESDEPFADADALAIEEKKRLLGEMDRRIDELAEQRSRELEKGRGGEGTN